MPFQPCPDVAKTEIRMTWDGKPVEYVLHWKRSPVAAWDAASIQGLANNVFTHFTNEFGPLMANAVAFASCYAVDLTTDGGVAFEYFPAAVVTGQLTGEIIPNNVALVMTHRTAQAGRSYRGRTYLGAWTEAEQARSFVTAGYGSAVESAWQDFITAVQATLVTFVVLSRRNLGVVRPAGVGTPVVSSGLRNLRVDTQKRRLPDEA